MSVGLLVVVATLFEPQLVTETAAASIDTKCLIGFIFLTFCPTWEGRASPRTAPNEEAIMRIAGQILFRLHTRHRGTVY